MAERGSRARVGAVVAALAIALLAACGSTAEPAPTDKLVGAPVEPPFDVSSTPLLDGDKRPFSLVADTDKALTLVFFGYTHCPDICGQVMATMAGAMARLDAADRGDVDVAFVTTDPGRDTPRVVEDYATAFDPTFLGLTGKLPDIAEVALSMGIGVEKGEKLPSGGYDITHGTQVMAIDAKDRAPVFWRHDVSQADLASDLQILLAEGR